ncbi:unnamed protein product [Thlaspi arvense]|uniref:NOL1/NOP2/NSUN 5/7 ferredoxin-like domain-containing protein n=1 Tax=Thlaspi arvense TaxID=13288 RepID=A0AAU9TAK9_THLAR|nr:unnamed protein product [Thlaspi arvense]
MQRQEELMYIISYDILFGQAASLIGDAEKFLLLQKDALQSALAQLLVKKGMKNIKELMACQQISDTSRPQYVRVNTLKLDLVSALQELRKQNMAFSANLHVEGRKSNLLKVHEDDMVPDLLVLPPGVDLHSHPLVANGSIFYASKYWFCCLFQVPV